MQKTRFEVSQMDCGAEESLVRLQLEPIDAIQTLAFDLDARQVTVFHDGELPRIEHSIQELGLGCKVLQMEEVESAPISDDHQVQRRTLWAVLLINFTFFVIEVVYGFLSHSMGLVADSLDMLADAAVYGMSLLAVGSVYARKKTVAAISGYFQLTLAALGFIEVVRRFISQEALPDFRTMIIVSLLALLANGASLYLLKLSNSQEVHMKASMIFTSNDVIINIGVMLAGVLVFWLGSPIPDLVVGAIVFAIVMRGALRILKLAR